MTKTVGDVVVKDSAIVVVPSGKNVQSLADRTLLPAKAMPPGAAPESAIQAATLRLLDALERRALKTSRRNNGTRKANLEDDEESEALPSGMPTLLLSETGWGGADTGQVEDRLYAVINTAADTLVTQLSGQKFDGICFALAGGLFCAQVGEKMAAGHEEQVSEVVTHLTDVLEAAVRFLSQHFDEVFIPCVCATGWSVSTSAPAGLANLLDSLVYKMLRARVADLIDKGRVAVEISSTACLAYALYGTTYLLSASGEGTGMRDPVSCPVVVHRSEGATGGYDYVVTGNRGASADGAGLIANGALNGRRPQQALWITHPVLGVSTMFSVFGEFPAVDSALPAYRTLKPVSFELSKRYA